MDDVIEKLDSLLLKKTMQKASLKRSLDVANKELEREREVFEQLSVNALVIKDQYKSAKLDIAELRTKRRVVYEVLEAIKEAENEAEEV